MTSALKVIKGGGVFDLPEIEGEECQERWVLFYFVFVWGFFRRCAHLYFYDKDDNQITAVRQWCRQQNATGIDFVLPSCLALRSISAKARLSRGG